MKVPELGNGGSRGGEGEARIILGHRLGDWVENSAIIETV